MAHNTSSTETALQNVIDDARRSGENLSPSEAVERLSRLEMRGRRSDGDRPHS